MASTQLAPETRITLIQPRSGWIAVDWRELWEGRELLLSLISREVMVRYKQTVLGVLWAVLQPVFSMLIFSVIFGQLAHIPSDGHPYPVFVYAGLLPWIFFSTTVTNASQSLVNQQALLTKIYLPRLFVPAASVGGGIVDFGISFLVFAALVFYYRIPLGFSTLAVPFLFMLTIVAALGVGLTLSALTVTYRDFRYIIPFMVQVWMYVSPVIYPVSMIPRKWQWLLALNPMAGLIDGYRSALLGQPWNFVALAVSSFSSLFLAVFGIFYFRKTEKRFADIA